MEETYIKVYNWTVEMPPYERLVFSLIHQFTIAGKELPGYWAGYKSMSEVIGLPKGRCKEVVAGLLERNQIAQRYETYKGKRRIVFTSRSEVVAFLKKTHTRAHAIDINK